MRLGTLLTMMLIVVWLVGTVEAGLIFVEDFETGELNKDAWELTLEGGQGDGQISDKKAHSGTYSWWIGSKTRISYAVDPALPTASVYISFYDNADEPRINATVLGCSGGDNWMYMGICTTGPECVSPQGPYYYRSIEDGELCQGAGKRKTGWHLFAYIIDGGILDAYIDGEWIEDCPMTKLGTITIFHSWDASQYLKDGSFVDDIFIFDDVRDPAEEPSQAVEPKGKLAVTLGNLKK